MTTFMDRFKQAIGERGYEPSLRRSIQTVILYEAYRCVATRIPSMRPFQRKLAFFDQAEALVEATGFLLHQQEEVMWRTGTSREAMTAETAWKRMRLIEKEVEKLQAKMKFFCEDGKSHDLIVDTYIQEQFESVSGNKGKEFPPGWEHTHNNVLMTYRLYFDGYEPDPTFPPATPMKEIVVPAAKPRAGDESGFLLQVPPDPSERGTVAATEAAGNAAACPVELGDDRMLILKEIRMHMDLLNDFIGIIPHDQLNRRKRELFQALPVAPPSMIQRAHALSANKRARAQAMEDAEGDMIDA